MAIISKNLSNFVRFFRDSKNEKEKTKAIKLRFRVKGL